MKLRFFKKRLPASTKNIQVIHAVEPVVEVVDNSKENIIKVEKPKNKSSKKNKENMDTVDKIKAAEATIDSMQQEVKVIKADKGLIERTESSKIILTEDNRQVLID